MAKWSATPTNCRFKWTPPAFTLIECLLALLVLGMALFFTTPLIETTIRAEKQMSSYRDQEFEVGMLQLDYEMRGFRYSENSQNILRYLDSDGKVVDFRVVSENFVKTYNRGHHPLVTKVTQIYVQKTKTAAMLTFRCKDGRFRYAKVLLEPPPKMETLDTP